MPSLPPPRHIPTLPGSGLSRASQVSISSRARSRLASPSSGKMATVDRTEGVLSRRIACSRPASSFSERLTIGTQLGWTAASRNGGRLWRLNLRLQRRQHGNESCFSGFGHPHIDVELQQELPAGLRMTAGTVKSAISMARFRRQRPGMARNRGHRGDLAIVEAIDCETNAFDVQRRRSIDVEPQPQTHETGTAARHVPPISCGRPGERRPRARGRAVIRAVVPGDQIFESDGAIGGRRRLRLASGSACPFERQRDLPVGGPIRVKSP